MELSRLGKRFRRRRQDLQKRLEDVAKEAEVTTAYLSQIETGKRNPSSHVRNRLAEVLGLSPDALAQDEDFEAQVRAFFGLREQRSSGFLRGVERYRDHYTLLSDCKFVASAPGTYAWAGQYNATNGGLEILGQTPSRIYVGLKEHGVGELRIERWLFYNPTVRAFEEVRFQGDAASLWRDHKDSVVGALLRDKLRTEKVAEFCQEHSFIVLSEVPYKRGWDFSGAQAACMAATMAQAADVIDQLTVKKWATTPCEELMKDDAFNRVARAAWKIQAMFHATASGGATAICPIIGGTSNPLVFVSEARDGSYQPPDKNKPKR
jgi:transcriptional regulator with XRE-family HTH domain